MLRISVRELINLTKITKNAVARCEPAAPGTGVIVVNGDEGSSCSQVVNSQCGNYLYDVGSLTVSVNGYSVTQKYGKGSTAAHLAAGLAAALNGDSASPVTAAASDSTVTVTAKTAGAVTNYALSSSSKTDNADTFYPSFSASSAPTLTGGRDFSSTTIPDSGTTAITVADHAYSYGWSGACTNPETIAYGLAKAINADLQAPVGAEADGNVITLWAETPGQAGNSLSLAASSTSAFNSFTATASASTLAGGVDSALTIPTAAYNYALTYSPDSNLAAASDSATGNWNYGYDNLNRLITASSTGGPCGLVNLSWTYDRFGNRLSQSSAGSSSPCYGTDTSLTFSGNNQMNGVDHLGNNRMDGFDYDAAGNLLSDGAHSYTYDAESRLLTVDTSIKYIYDAEGRRVAKVQPNGTNSATLLNSYIRGLGGEQLSELDGSGKWIHTNIYGAGLLGTYKDDGFHYHYSDWLGTRRWQTKADGAAELSMFNLPFGDSLMLTGGVTDATEEHFTGQEHDQESDLEHFQARQYASTLGRWLTPDPGGLAVVDPGNPQSWNRYAYVLNNPVNAIDPLGLQDAHPPLMDMDDDDGGGDYPVPPPPPPPAPMPPLPEPEPYIPPPPTVSTTVNVSANFPWVPLNDAETQLYSLLLGFNTPNATMRGTTCPAVRFKVTGIAPGQAPGTTAISHTPRAGIPDGGVAIKPANFGAGGVNSNNRYAFLNMTFTADWSTASPSGVPSGLPTLGRFSPVDVIGPASVRNSPGNALDVYNYPSFNQALTSTRNVSVTTFIPTNTAGVICPKPD